MKRRVQQRFIVSRYNAAETYDRTTHPEKYPQPAIHYGEVLSFADEAWALWFATKRGWFLFGNTLFPLSDTGNFLNVDNRCSMDTLSDVFASVLERIEEQKLAAACVKNKLTPTDYEETISDMF